MSSRKAVTLLELDMPRCALDYGETTAAGTCPAVLGVDSQTKCYNTRATCPVLQAFTPVDQTYRYAVPTAYLPPDLKANPIIKDVSFTPAEVSLGRDLGKRATLKVTFRDRRWSDTRPGYDKYVAERPYDPYHHGTYWGRWRARHPYMRTRPARLIQGFADQAPEQMEARHFFLEKFNGVTPDGEYTVEAKDLLKYASGDRALAPRQSNGFLVADIGDAVDEQLTLSPAGIGDAEYPASGRVNIGAGEIARFTRAGDVMTLIERGVDGTTPSTHEAGDRVQLCLRFEAATPATILATYFRDYTEMAASTIPQAEWELECATKLQRVYTTTIAEPTAVDKLASEMIEQAALKVWWDDLSLLLRLRVLGLIATEAEHITPDVYEAGTLTVKEQPDERISRTITYFGQRTPLEKVDEKKSYRSAVMTIDAEAEAAYGSPALRQIFSRYIPKFGRSAAQRLNDLQNARFRDPPRRFTFEIMRGRKVVPEMGRGYRLSAWPFQDASGAIESVPIEITRLRADPDRYVVEAEELLFHDLDPIDPLNRVIDIDVNDFNLDIRQIHDTLYPAPTEQDVIDGVTLTVRLFGTAHVGSESTQQFAIDFGETGVDWPAGFPIRFEYGGRAQGRGGDGGPGAGGGSFVDGGPGGPAIRLRHPVTFADTGGGQIWSGAGGGAAFASFAVLGGGGAAGNLPGAGGPSSLGPDGEDGTTEAGGAGAGDNTAGNPGGDPGQPGANATGTGGAPGAAIDGISLVTHDGPPGDIRGPQIN